MNLHVPIDDPTEGNYLSVMRYHRNRLLAASDWTVLPDSPVDRQAWETYRQQLRDFPSTWKPGPTADFPNPPA